MRGSRETTDSRSAVHPLRTAALLCAIGAPLILAGALERDVERGAPAVPRARAAAPPPIPPPRPAEAEPEPVPLPIPPDERSVVDLAERARDDARRLRDESGFTLQFAVMCRGANVTQILAALGADSHLFVLPVTVDGRPCHRVCYGTYPTEAAARAASRPEPLRTITDSPRAVSVTGLVP